MCCLTVLCWVSCVLYPQQPPPPQASSSSPPPPPPASSSLQPCARQQRLITFPCGVHSFVPVSSALEQRDLTSACIHFQLLCCWLNALNIQSKASGSTFQFFCSAKSIFAAFNAVTGFANLGVCVPLSLGGLCGHRV